LGIVALSAPALGKSRESRAAAADKPNFIIIFTDAAKWIGRRD
jgi:hypothetical protein